MSFPTYGNYISGRRAYRSGESCIAAGPKGEKGDSGGQKGEKGQKGLKGQKGDKGLKGEIGIQGVTGATGTVLGGVGMIDSWFVPNAVAASTNPGQIDMQQMANGDGRGLIRDATNQMAWTAGTTYPSGFQFPQTGIYTIESHWKIRWNAVGGTTTHISRVEVQFYDASSWKILSSIYADDGATNIGSQITQTFSGKTIVDVTDINTQRLKFVYTENIPSNSEIQPDADKSWVHFIRAGLPGEKGAKGSKGATGTVLGGVGMIDMFHVTSSTITSDTDNVEYTQTPETIAGTGATYGVLRGVGNQMVHWPGNLGGHGFEFPQTGIYTIESTHRFRSNLTYTGSSHYISVQMSNDSSNSWETIKEITAFTDLNQQESTSQLFHTLHGKTTVRITNTTTERIRFKYNSGNQGLSTTNALIGGNSRHSYIIITKAGLPGEKGAKGDKGQKGETGSTGATGAASTVAGPTGPTGPSVLMGTYVFAHQNLTGQATSWTDEPPNPPTDVDVTGNYSGDLTDLEFITPGAFCGVNVGSTNFSFPRTNASDTLTEANASTSAHNNVFGYVIPADGTLLGFTVDLIAKGGSKPEFYVFVYDATSSPTAGFVGPITSTTGIENFGSAYNFDVNSKITCKAGNYLFAVQKKGTGVAKQLVHITAYIRYEK